MSLRNAVKRKTHKERSQPQARQRFGLLEKHGDYVKRARDYHSKQNRLKALQDKADNRNPDEFYFKMINTKTKDGIHVVERKSTSGVQLKKSTGHDLGYLALKRTAEKRKIERLQSGLHMLAPEGTSLNSHTLFFDDEDEAQSFSPQDHFDTIPELANCAYNRPRVKTLETEMTIGRVTDRDLEKMEKSRAKSYRELEEREKRQKRMADLQDEIDLQKNLMGKGKRIKVSDGGEGKPPVFKWAKERKK